jgi:ribonucleotide monophosphatase NagD (HAD superfamily)
MMEQALARLGLATGEVAMIGDRLDTDILGGINAGLATIMVLTGVSTRTEAEGGAIAPDYIVEDLPALLALLDAEGVAGGAAVAERLEDDGGDR